MSHVPTYIGGFHWTVRCSCWWERGRLLTKERGEELFRAHFASLCVRCHEAYPVDGTLCDACCIQEDRETAILGYVR